MQFIGNFKAKQTLNNWLNEHYNGIISTKCPKCSFPILSKTSQITCPKCRYTYDHQTKPYAVIWGDSGNGKTYICKYFAVKYDAELVRVTADSFNSDSDVYNFIKSLSVSSFDYKHKLILVDDIDEFIGRLLQKTLKTIISEVKKVSRYPVIFTTRVYPRNFKDALIIHLSKPYTKELVSYLKTLKPDIPESTLYDLAEHSPSFRSVVLSLDLLSPNDTLQPYISNRMLVDLVKQRKVDQPLTSNDIRKIFDSLSNLDSKSIAVMQYLSYLDFFAKRYKNVLVSYEHTIHPAIINNIPYIDEVKLRYRYVSKRP